MHAEILLDIFLNYAWPCAGLAIGGLTAAAHQPGSLSCPPPARLRRSASSSWAFGTSAPLPCQAMQSHRRQPPTSFCPLISMGGRCRGQISSPAAPRPAGRVRPDKPTFASEANAAAVPKPAFVSVEPPRAAMAWPSPSFPPPAPIAMSILQVQELKPPVQLSQTEQHGRDSSRRDATAALQLPELSPLPDSQPEKLSLLTSSRADMAGQGAADPELGHTMRLASLTADLAASSLPSQPRGGGA